MQACALRSRSATSAANLKFLQQLPQARSGTSNRRHQAFCGYEGATAIVRVAPYEPISMCISAQRRTCFAARAIFFERCHVTVINEPGRNTCDSCQDCYRLM